MLSPVQKQAQSALVLANASTIVSCVIKQIAGNDISNSLNGSRITDDIIHSLVNQRINTKLEAQAKAI